MNSEREIVVRVPEHLVSSGQFQLDISINLRNVAAGPHQDQAAHVGCAPVVAPVSAPTTVDVPTVPQIEGPQQNSVESRARNMLPRPVFTRPYQYAGVDSSLVSDRSFQSDSPYKDPSAVYHTEPPREPPREPYMEPFREPLPYREPYRDYREPRYRDMGNTMTSVSSAGTPVAKKPKTKRNPPKFPNSILGSESSDGAANTLPDGKFTPKGLKLVMESIKAGTPALEIFPLFPNISKSAFKMRYSRLKNQKDAS